MREGYTRAMGMGKLKSWRLLLPLVVAALATAAVVRFTGSDADSGEAGPAAMATPNVVQAGAPGDASRTPSEDELAEIEPPSHTKADVEFVWGMIHHHAQGIEMTGYVPDRSVGRDLPLLAKRTEISQESEIELMERWLQDRGEEAPDAGEHAHGHGGELMPGMLTASELGELKAASGRAFNRRFLRFMIRHHQGALAMIWQLRRANGGMEPELDKLAREIEADQSIEISRMRRLLARL